MCVSHIIIFARKLIGPWTLNIYNYYTNNSHDSNESWPKLYIYYYVVDFSYVVH